MCHGLSGNATVDMEGEEAGGCQGRCAGPCMTGRGV